MSEIQKGIILTLEGPADKNNHQSRAMVQSTSADGTSTLPITIPWYLRGPMGDLKKGDEVAYARFDDETGVILSRMDGEWSGNMEEEKIHIKAAIEILGSTKAEDIDCTSLTGDSVVSAGVALATHVHGGIKSGSDRTERPE